MKVLSKDPGTHVRASLVRIILSLSEVRHKTTVHPSKMCQDEAVRFAKLSGMQLMYRSIHPRETNAVSSASSVYSTYQKTGSTVRVITMRKVAASLEMPHLPRVNVPTGILCFPNASGKHISRSLKARQQCSISQVRSPKGVTHLNDPSGPL